MERNYKQAAWDIENGNGCSSKALLDSASNLEERLDIFRTLQQKHNEIFPNSDVKMQSGVPYRGNTVDMSIIATEKWKSWYGSESARLEIFHDKFDPADSSHKSNCQDLKQGPHPHSDRLL